MGVVVNHHSLISHHAASLFWASLLPGSAGFCENEQNILVSLGLSVPSQVSTAETVCTDQQHKNLSAKMQNYCLNACIIKSNNGGNLNEINLFPSRISLLNIKV